MLILPESLPPTGTTLPPLKTSPANTALLWEALFAITYAAETLGVTDELEGLGHQRLEIGAYSFARLALENSQQEPKK